MAHFGYLSGVMLVLQKEHLEFGEFEWLSDIGLFGEHVSPEALSAAEVPQLPAQQSTGTTTSYKVPKFSMPHNKKPRIEIMPDDEEEFFTVPDLG